MSEKCAMESVNAHSLMVKGDLYTQEYLLNERIYDGFISLFRDQNPLHTNPAFARNNGFAERVMHGNILNGFLSHFVGECLPTKNVVLHNQEINYLKPVYLNDLLQLTAEVEDYFESVKVVSFRFYFKNQGGMKVARGKLSIGLL